MDLMPDFITYHLADVFIQSDLQLIRLSRRHNPWSNVGVEGLAQGPNSCADLILATPGIEPPAFRVQVHLLSHYATGCPACMHFSVRKQSSGSPPNFMDVSGDVI